MSQPSTSQLQSPTGGSQPVPVMPVPAQPPSRSEIERKLSFRSSSNPRTVAESPKKKKSTHPPPPHVGHHANPTSGNESDSSSITSSTLPPVGSPNPTSPIISPATTSVGGLSAIAERKAAGGDMIDEMELADVEEEAEDELEEVEGEGEGEGENESGSEDEAGLQGLERGMEGERVVKSGYLYKKQERRKAWKKRWFVLRTGKLAYYKDEKEYSLKRVLDLHDVHTVAPVTVKKHPHSFGIVTPKRTFFAKAGSQDEMDEWVRAINGVRRRISEREEEERSKREKGDGGVGAHHHQVRSTSIPIPARDRERGSETVDTTSPTSTSGSYFVHRPNVGSPQTVHAAGHISPGLAAGGIIPPSSPMDTTNSLASQMAKMSIPTPRTPSNQSLPSQPIGSFFSSPHQPSTAGSLPASRAVSGPSTSSRREASTSSIGSSAAADAYSRPSALALPGGGNSSAVAASSEDEDDIEGVEGGYFDGNRQQSAPSTPIDPNKVILSAYLMKRSSGRGRKVWRKRWFVLTSQGMTYTKSHMDTRAIRFVPLSSVLDALEVNASDASSGSDSDQPPAAHNFAHVPFHSSAHSGSHPHGHSYGASGSASGPGQSTFPPPPQRQPFSQAMRGRLSSNESHGYGHGGAPTSSSTPKKIPSSSGHGGNEKHGHGHGEINTFRLITAKRTYVLCAPSEEDEIKWLAAFRALLNQSRVSNQAPPLSPTLPLSATRVPFITQQPPTPASLPPSGPGSVYASTESVPQGQGAGSRSASQQGATGDKDLPSTPTGSVPVPGSSGLASSLSQAGQSASASGSASTNTGISAGALANAYTFPTPHPPSPMNRGRSATYMAKSAVADVVRKFHPES